MSAKRQAKATETTVAGEDIVHRIVHMNRMLRDRIGELGPHTGLDRAPKAIPDASDRLSYIGSMAEQAAERALNAIDRAQPIQASLASGAQDLAQRWQAWYDAPVELERARELVRDTRAYLDGVP